MPSPEPHLQDARLGDEALAWFVRRQDAGWKNADESAFQQWQSSDPRHAQLYADCVNQWSKFDGMPADLATRMRRNLVRDKALVDALQPLPASSHWLAHHSQARDFPGKAPSLPQLSRRRFFQPALAIAGTAAMTSGAGYFLWQQVQAQPVLVQTFSTTRGQQKEIPLPDGTRLRLDTATQIEVTYYKQRREVKLLDGQAVFAVHHDATRPFHVLAGPLQVTVVGTQFSVRHTPRVPGTDGVQVAVEEGKVRVARLHGSSDDGEASNGMFLTAGQQIASDSQGTLSPVVAVASDGFAPWREQRISFIDTPLEQALAELERYGDTGIVVRDATVASMRLTGTFDPMNRTTLRLALPRVLPVRLEARGSKTEVLPAK